MNEALRRSSAALAAMLLAGAALTACGGAGGPQETAGGSGSAPAESKPAGPTAITALSIFYTPEPPAEDDPIRKEIEKRTNTELKITWVSPNSYTEKYSVTMASGDMPDMLLLTDPFDPQFKTMVQQGAFWDLTPFIPQYANLSALPKEVWDNVKIKGNNYGIPRSRPLYGGGGMPLLRNDWLEALGLKYPETMDELYQALKAFAEKDPDGNGKHDTAGLAVNVGADNMGNLGFVENVFNVSTGPWKLKDGKLTHTALEPATKLALQWMVNAYKDGVIPQDFATLKATQLRDLVKASKAGGWVDATNPSWLLTGEMRKTNPKADLLPASYLIGPSGTKYAPKDSGTFGMFVIPKSVKEDKLKKILEFMDFGASEEGWVLANFGLKDVHYTSQEDLRTNTEEGKKVMSRSGMINFYSNLDKYARAIQVGIPMDFYKRNKGVIDEREKHGVPDVSFGLSSDTFDKYGKEYEKKMTDLKVKIILGSEPLEAWDRHVEQLKADAQFMKMIEEMNAAYREK